MKNNLSNKICGDRKTKEVLYHCAAKNKFANKNEVIKPVTNLKLVEKLPLLLNINCMMNVEIKQKQPVWQTNFGKRLIYGNDFKQKHVFLETEKRFMEKTLRESTKDLIELRRNKVKRKNGMVTMKNNSAFSTTTQGDERDNVLPRNLMTPKKSKMKRSEAKGYKISERKKKNLWTNRMNNNDDNNLQAPMTPSTFSKNKSKPLIIDKENDLCSYESSRVSSCDFTSVKNHSLLTECVKNILDNISNELICEHCERSFPNINEVINHKKTHEREKRNCLLCDKVFYKADEFIQHLLTHEGVDTFSCKKCKKYFPTSKTYKKHYKEFHQIAPTIMSTNDEAKEKFKKEWTPTYKCFRCKAEFGSREMQKNHLSNHLKMDLTGAYLLCPDNL